MPPKKSPPSLYSLLGIGTTSNWPKTELDRLLQAVCAGFAIGQKDERRKHRTSQWSYPELKQLDAAACHHLALCVDVLRCAPAVHQSYLHRLHIETDTRATCRRMQSDSRFKEWLSVHLRGATQSHIVGSHGNDAYWFRPPTPGVDLIALIDFLSKHQAQCMVVSTTKPKIAALPVRCLHV